MKLQIWKYHIEPYTWRSYQIYYIATSKETKEEYKTWYKYVYGIMQAIKLVRELLIADGDEEVKLDNIIFEIDRINKYIYEEIRKQLNIKDPDLFD